MLWAGGAFGTESLSWCRFRVTTFLERALNVAPLPNCQQGEMLPAKDAMSGPHKHRSRPSQYQVHVSLRTTISRLWQPRPGVNFTTRFTAAACHTVPVVACTVYGNGCARAYVQKVQAQSIPKPWTARNKT